MLIFSKEQIDWFLARIPQSEPNPKGGRPEVDRRKTLEGIFWMLDNGAKWKDLPRRFGSKSTVHRWFQIWTQAGVFEAIMQDAGRLVEERDGFKLYECFIDGTFANAKGGGDGIGCTKAGKGVKIMVLVDARGLPVSVETMAANHHESTLVQQLFDFMLSSELPARIIGDKAYDSDKLDDQLAREGIEMIAPHRRGRKPENTTQDARNYLKTGTLVDSIECGMLKLTAEQLNWLADQIPDRPKSSKGGRPVADKRTTLRGIFWMLDNGAKWKDLPRQFGSRATVHRWFQRWTREGLFEQAMRAAGRLVETRGAYRVYECFIDGSFAKAKGGGDGIGRGHLGKGVKIMVLVDARGLPVAIDAAPADAHESRCVQALFDFMLTREPPPRVIGDKAYDSDKLDAAMAERGVERIAPHRENRKAENVTQDRRPLQRAARRWTVERTIAWMQNYRRLCIRWEKASCLFSGFLHMTCTLLLLSEVLR